MFTNVFTRVSTFHCSHFKFYSSSAQGVNIKHEYEQPWSFIHFWKTYRRCNYRRIIIEKILAEGGETFTGYIPVSRSRLAESLRVSVFTLNKSPIGMRSVDLVRKRESRNMTFNLLVSLNGSEYFNLVDGATNTIEFLNFLSEAAEVVNVTTRRPALHHEDMVVMDNHAGPHFDGGDVLEEWLSEMGIELIYKPVYSPDLNPIESCFGKVKAMSVSTFSSSVPKSKMTFSAQIT